MNVALLNEKIMIQKNTVTVDEIGNRINAWEDFFSCYATVGGSSSSAKGGSQVQEAGTTEDKTDLSFTVRYCSETLDVDMTHYRILFRDEVYDIVSIDYMNFKKKCLKFRCRRERHGDTPQDNPGPVE